LITDDIFRIQTTEPVCLDVTIAGRSSAAVVLFGQEHTVIELGVRGFLGAHPDRIELLIGIDARHIDDDEPASFPVPVFGMLSVREQSWATPYLEVLTGIQIALMWAMLSMTLFSGLQYAWKAMRMLS